MARTDSAAGPVLLDTHLWVWYVEGDRTRFAARIEPIVEAAVERGAVLVSAAIAIESTRLPGNPHRDPADRMLIATARLSGAALVTCDARLVAYAKDGHVKVIDARR
jgi:PIN domain nuclease of toxin-antitoxin system